MLFVLNMERVGLFFTIIMSLNGFPLIIIINYFAFVLFVVKK